MIRFLRTLRSRNPSLYYFGWCCLLCALGCAALVFTTDNRVLGINAWIKPLKFFLSSAIFSWTMGWIMAYLEEPKKVAIFSWVVIGVLAFETIYIAIQAGQGELSHFNNSTRFHNLMFGLMGLFITVMTLWTAYIGWLFFRKPFPVLPPAYLWGIRIGIVLFVFFALEGGMMGQHLAHTIGAPDGGPGLPLVNWSTTHGDLRIAHFMGMHGLQLVPLVSFYILKQKWATIIFGLAWFGLATLLLAQALQGIPLITT